MCKHMETKEKKCIFKKSVYIYVKTFEPCTS